MSASSTAAALVIVGAGALALGAARILGALYANHLMRRAFREHAQSRQGYPYGEDET